MKIAVIVTILSVLVAIPVVMSGPERIVDSAALEERIKYIESQKLDRWILENQYIIACDQLRAALGQSTNLTKLGFADLVPMMMTLRSANRDAYDLIKDTMDMLNSALIRHDIKWWDTCVWHPEIAQ